MKLHFTAAMISWMLLINGVCLAEDDHNHENESCACAAEEDGFVIDCSNQVAMKDAEGALAANNCNTDCSTEICHRNYLLVQSHHDYCLPTEVTPSLEVSFHLYEDTCGHGCDISAKADPSLPDCPQANCVDDSGNQAYAAFAFSGCARDCTSNACGRYFRTMLIVHDTCPEDTLSATAEAAFHSIEEKCQPLHGCNILAGDGAENPLVCRQEISFLGAIASAMGAFLSSILFCF